MKVNCDYERMCLFLLYIFVMSDMTKKRKIEVRFTKLNLKKVTIQLHFELIELISYYLYEFNWV